MASEVQVAAKDPENLRLMKEAAAQLPTNYEAGWHDDVDYVYRAERGLSQRIVEEISDFKNEPRWMRQFRLDSLKHFESRPMPTWGADLSGLDFDRIRYYIRPTDKKSRTWDEVPAEIKQTFELEQTKSWTLERGLEYSDPGVALREMNSERVQLTEARQG